MKAILLVSSMLSAVALGDIVVPGGEFASANYSGSEAQAIYESLNVEEQTEYVLRLSTVSKVKILRPEDGLFEIACTKLTQQRRRASYECMVKQSTDGQPVPRYRMRRRLG